VSIDPGSVRRCQLLREDSELAEAVPTSRRAEAIEQCSVPVVEIPPGTWTGQGPFPFVDGVGLLLLEGVLIRRVGIERRFGAELLGEGDLLRPWQEESAMLPLTIGWSVIEPLRLAILGDEFARHLGRYPELAAPLMARAIQRSRNLAVNMAIVHQARVDVRLNMLLWHLAGRWGRVRSEGTVLRMRLTHAVLAELVAARRPTVTSALADLVRRGLMRGGRAEWVLFGEPPRELDGTGPPAEPVPLASEDR
jgi:hypothetical protein